MFALGRRPSLGACRHVDAGTYLLAPITSVAANWHHPSLHWYASELSFRVLAWCSRHGRFAI